MAGKPEQLTLAGIADGTVCRCERCEVPLRVNPKPGTSARMLKRAKTTKGFCANCAMHDWLRNTYPINIQLAESGPSPLVHAHVRRQVEEIMRVGNADASPDEIDWDRIIANWELPFPRPVKPTAENPMHEKDLQEITRGERKALRPQTGLPYGDGVIRSFEELNALGPGLGDDLKQALDEQMGAESAEDADRIGQDLQD